MNRQSGLLLVPLAAGSRHVRPSEMARAALGYITNRERWTRGDYFEEDASCAMGAFVRTAQQDPPLSINGYDYYEMLDVLLATLRENLPHIDASSIDEFNDHPSVQHQDIVAAFEKTASFFEEQGR